MQPCRITSGHLLALGAGPHFTRCRGWRPLNPQTHTATDGDEQAEQSDRNAGAKRGTRADPGPQGIAQKGDSLRFSRMTRLQLRFIVTWHMLRCRSEPGG